MQLISSRELWGSSEKHSSVCIDCVISEFFKHRRKVKFTFQGMEEMGFIATLDRFLEKSKIAVACSALCDSRNFSDFVNGFNLLPKFPIVFPLENHAPAFSLVSSFHGGHLQ
jgi:hypothetical protein